MTTTSTHHFKMLKTDLFLEFFLIHTKQHSTTLGDSHVDQDFFNTTNVQTREVDIQYDTSTNND